jgi:hypothetical protein
VVVLYADMSLGPLALTFALLVFWIGLGCSLIAAAEPKMEPLKALFLVPVTGVAATLLPSFWLSLIGPPVASFARPLLAVLPRPRWTFPKRQTPSEEGRLKRCSVAAINYSSVGISLNERT